MKNRFKPNYAVPISDLLLEIFEVEDISKSDTIKNWTWILSHMTK